MGIFLLLRCNPKEGMIQNASSTGQWFWGIWCTTSDQLTQLKSIWLFLIAQVAQLKTGSWQSLELKRSQPFEAANEFGVEHQLLPTCAKHNLPIAILNSFEDTKLTWMGTIHDKVIALLDSVVVTTYCTVSS